MAKRKKSSTKGRKPAAAKKRSSPTKRVARKSKKPAKRALRGRAPSGAVRALVAGKLPAPIYGVPREKVGSTVQRFIDWDGVSEMSVLEEAMGTFQVTPLA